MDQEYRKVGYKHADEENKTEEMVTNISSVEDKQDEELRKLLLDSSEIDLSPLTPIIRPSKIIIHSKVHKFDLILEYMACVVTHFNCH